MHLAGSLVAFDTTTENYTVSVSGKCVLTCYVSEIRSFKVSQSYLCLWNMICCSERSFSSIVER